MMKNVDKNCSSLNPCSDRPSSISDLMKPLDEMTDDILDEAIHCVDDIYCSFMNEKSTDISLFRILESIGKISPGFTYAFSRDEDDRLTGVVWMTSVMRSNFERYSQFICIDAMKKKTNVSLFPYMSITVLDEMNKVQVCCEALVMQERKEAYTFMIRLALSMAPKVDPDRIKNVFGDKFITRSLLNESRLEGSRILYDHFHLDLNFQEELPPHIYHESKGLLRSILNSYSEECFDKLIVSLIDLNKGNVKVIKLANKLRSERLMFARYVIEASPGTYGRLGDSISESNHSSVSAHVGDKCLGELESIHVRLMDRHKHVCLRTNREVSRAYHQSRIIEDNLSKKKTKQDLLLTAKTLTLSSYNEYASVTVIRSQQYCKEETKDGTTVVFSPLGNNRYHFKNKTSRCTCHSSVALEKQCVHERCFLGHFQPNYFSLKYHRRESITRSTYIGEYKNPTCPSSIDVTSQCIEIDKIGCLDDELDVDVDNPDTNVFYKTTLNLPGVKK